MESKHYAALSLLGLAALCSALPQTKAVTTARTPSVRPLVSSPAAASLPCGPSSFFSPMTADPFPVHLLPARSMTGPANATFLTESLWLDPNRVINVMDGTSQLAIFDSGTGKQILLDAVNAIYEHQKIYKDPFSMRISPDGHWVLWPSGSNARPTWAAVSIDGQERREWPRATGCGTLDVAWMQDNRHWVQLSQADLGQNVSGGSTCKVRVYDTETHQVEERPLVLSTPVQGFLLPTQCAYTQFAFTQDGRSWLSILWSGCSPTAQFPTAGSRLEAYELLPGQTAWTLKKSSTRLGSYAEVGTSDECVRSPDDNWLIWRNYAMNGKGPMRLVLTRADGGDPQVVQTAESGNSLCYIHWAGDSQHVAFYQGSAICQLTLTDLEAEASHSRPCTSSQVASRTKVQGKFPVAAHQGKLIAQVSANSQR